MMQYETRHCFKKVNIAREATYYILNYKRNPQLFNLSLVLRKPVFGVSDQVRPGPTQTGLYNNRRWLEAGNFVFRKKRDCTIYVAKTKALISFAVTAKLICVFVFAYAKSRFFSRRGSFVPGSLLIWLRFEIWS